MIAQDLRTGFLELHHPARQQDRVWTYDYPIEARSDDEDVLIEADFRLLDSTLAPREASPRRMFLRLRAYGPEILRLTLSPDPTPLDDAGPMLEMHPSLRRTPLTVSRTESEFIILGAADTPRARLRRYPVILRGGKEEGKSASAPLSVSPDGRTEMPLMVWDSFSVRPESLPLAFVEHDERLERALFAFQASPGERFAATGERFRKLDLAGGTYALANTDALGSNNRRSYKNVPFYLSDRPYGLFAHTSAHCQLSLTDYSTRAAQGLIEEPRLDLFLIGGGDWPSILYHYRCLTGFPPVPPLWTFGTWMSKCTYHSADEVNAVAKRLREEDYPCDVLHVDTGWFKYEWVCDWKFGLKRFPDPPAFIADLGRQGFRLSLWQAPYLAEGNPLLAEATANGYLSKNSGSQRSTSDSDLSATANLSYLDFTSPAAVNWYQNDLLRPLLEMGVAAIKTDFGEDIDLTAEYYGMDAAKLHNIYSLLYHQAAAKITEEVTGARFVFARSAWAGSQRYPIHWAGDTAGTWEGMLGALYGGLHLGLSGFAFWTHDVGGFYGVPDFLNSLPSPDLFLRWTQFGVLSSHLRFHGTAAREPYAYPEVSDIVRQWLKLRYALIPYLVGESRYAARSGLPVLSPLILHHPDDPFCWTVNDQYYLGRDLLVAPIFNPESRRPVYLPKGDWIDFWSGQAIRGPQLIETRSFPLDTIPLYLRAGAKLPLYPHPVASTNEMDFGLVTILNADSSFRGAARSFLGPLCGFTPPS